VKRCAEFRRQHPVRGVSNTVGEASGNLVEPGLVVIDRSEGGQITTNGQGPVFHRRRYVIHFGSTFRPRA
jgi:hypothetical protein